MMPWERVRLDWLITEERQTVDPSTLESETAFHYSIPVFDEVSDGRLESTDDILSGKLVLSGGEILVSKLNPRIPRVLRAISHEVPTLASTEFIALRPGPCIDERFVRYLLTSEPIRQGMDAATMSVTRSHQRVRPEAVTKMWVHIPDLKVQKATADYLDTETSRLAEVIDKKQRLLALLDERIDARIRSQIAESGLVDPDCSTVPLNRVLRKVRRPADSEAEILTAYRDGQVTTRSLRRPEGYTEATADHGVYQGVLRDDVVVHGLDGFAGAIGVSEAEGKCSPVYHVCVPTDGHDSAYLARMLRLLATSGYLELFATSTRERAFDFRNWMLFGRIPVPNVSPTEQASVGAEIRRLWPLKTAVERSTALARERRQALITAAVTGELEVPGVAS
jgi:type I restriction enzyme S subunit